MEVPQQTPHGYWPQQKPTWVNGAMLMQQIQPVNAETQSRPRSTCWNAHFLKMNAAWKIWQLLMRRLSTVQEHGQTYDSVQGWWTRKKDLEKGHFLGVRNGGGGGASASGSAPAPPPPPVPPLLSSTTMVLPKTSFAWPGRLFLRRLLANRVAPIVQKIKVSSPSSRAIPWSYETRTKLLSFVTRSW